MRIYVASSWRNVWQQGVVRLLRDTGHEVYDYRQPTPGNDGFHWSAIDEDWRDWRPEQYQAALAHPIAEELLAWVERALPGRGVERQP